MTDSLYPIDHTTYPSHPPFESRKNPSIRKSFSQGPPSSDAPKSLYKNKSHNSQSNLKNIKKNFPQKKHQKQHSSQPQNLPSQKLNSQQRPPYDSKKNNNLKFNFKKKYSPLQLNISSSANFEPATNISPVLSLTSPFNVDSKFLNNLSSEISDLNKALQPTDKSNQVKMKFLSKLSYILKNEFPDSDVEICVFGSSVNGLGTFSSDVDICLITKDHSLENILLLNKALRKYSIKTFCIPRARVPIVKLFDPELRVCSDINVNNTIALVNTKMIQTFLAIDPRALPFAMVIKHWAKQREINDAAFGGTLSPYSWVNLALSFLQMRNPPILPTLHPSENPYVDPTLDYRTQKPNLEFNHNLSKLIGYGTQNKESIGELLFEFFKHFGTEFDYLNNVVSLRHGRYLDKKEKGWDIGRPKKILCIEEPFSTWLNLAHGANHYAVEGIFSEILRAHNILKSGGSLYEVCEKFYSSHSKQNSSNKGFSFEIERNHTSSRFCPPINPSKDRLYGYPINKSIHSKSNSELNSSNLTIDSQINSSPNGLLPDNIGHTRSLSVETLSTSPVISKSFDLHSNLSPIIQSPITTVAPEYSKHPENYKNNTFIDKTPSYNSFNYNSEHTSFYKKSQERLRLSNYIFSKPSPTRNLTNPVATNGKRLSISALASSICYCPSIASNPNYPSLPIKNHLPTCVLGSLVANSLSSDYSIRRSLTHKKSHSTKYRSYINSINGNNINYHNLNSGSNYNHSNSTLPSKGNLNLSYKTLIVEPCIDSRLVYNNSNYEFSHPYYIKLMSRSLNKNNKHFRHHSSPSILESIIPNDVSSTKCSFGKQNTPFHLNDSSTQSSDTDSTKSVGTTSSSNSTKNNSNTFEGFAFASDKDCESRGLIESMENSHLSLKYL
ncbi:Poly(A) RNA polymerase cid11 [Smittium culicis]|uniref:polynucleotide adenylyltransferase n=1 Tax=Smittium culicis TaxID=133412 RepID=A0A1R1Y5P8_9FUNG|nr:Poly(A) RNA polymerase cid11 [Smittium culicis]OMJ27718.1 Poly(A) RNA polymerase cid11 [Smittium culicis]